MAYPRVRSALLEMVRREALSVPMARNVARKAGLRRGSSPAGIRTVISGYVDPMEEPHGRQYLADLTGVTRWRLVSRSSAPIYVMQSQEGGNALAAGTYFALEDSGTPFGADTTTGTDWIDLHPFFAVPCRLAVSTRSGAVAMEPLALDGPFSLLMQVE